VSASQPTDATAADDPSDVDVRRWRNAVFVIFALSGASVSSWAARIPAARDALHIDAGKVGLLILSMSIGSVCGLFVTGWAAQRFGHRRGMSASLLVVAVGLVLAGFGATVAHDIPLTVLGLFLLGLGNGCVDVMMNVSGAAAERRIGRTLMPLMHACFSIGTVIGAAIGAGAAALGVPVSWHLLGAAVVIALGGVASVRFVPDRVVEDDSHAVPDRFEDPGVFRRFGARLVARLEVWRDPRLVLIGVVMLGMAFAEGSANDWLALASVDGHGVSTSKAAVILDVFMVSMTLGRTVGGPVVDRIGRVAAIRVTATLAIAGLLLFILGSAPEAYVAGTVLWGLGACLGFPLGMSAAADDHANATARVASVAMIGYLAFLAGPPFIGFLADHVGLLHALYVIVALVIAALLAAPALRPSEPES
jgi:MFS family permease